MSSSPRYATLKVSKLARKFSGIKASKYRYLTMRFGGRRMARGVRGLDLEKIGGRIKE